MKKRQLTLLFILGLVLAALPVKVFAAEGGGSSEDSGSLILNKWVEEAGDGSFNLMLESYATGSDGTVVQKPKPVDIVLVLDESGSMGDVLIDGCDNVNGTDVEVTAAGNLLESNSSFPQADRDQKLFVGHKVFADNLDTSKTYTVVYPEASGVGDATRDITYCPECDGWFSIADHNQHSKIAEWIPFANEDEKVSGEHTSAEDWEYTVQFYERCGQTGRDILQNSLSSFLTSLKENSAGVDNRVAIVGYGQGASYVNSDGTRSQVYPDFGDQPGGDPVSDSADLASKAWNKVADLSEDSIDTWINGVQANGSTPTHLGIEAAEIAFDNIPESNSASDRSKVMILFTDGAPGANYVNFGPGSESGPDWVTPALRSAKRMKDEGVTVYSVGLFPSANGYGVNNITYDASRNGQGTEGFFLNANCFLHAVSSNFPSSTSIDATGRGTLNTDYAEGEKSYYLGTQNANELDEIFNEILSQVRPGETTVTLDENAVLRDTVAQDFKIPGNGEGVTAWTESYTGGDLDAADSWSKDGDSLSTPDDASAPLKVEVDGSSVAVTNFDYAENFVHTDENGAGAGKKLVVKIPIDPATAVTCGVKLPTNESGAGVYQDKDASTPVERFPLPHVDLPTSVTVQKVVKGAVPAADADKAFGFTVSGTQVKQGGDSAYTNVPATQTGVGESNYLKLNSEPLTSEFSLADGESQVLDDIIVGSKLTISEEAAEGYTPLVTVGDSTTALSPNSDGSYTVDVEPGMVITFTNVTYGIKVEKIDRDTNDPLKGAEFTLECQRQDGTWGLVDTRTTGDDGLVSWAGLSAGAYRVTETQVPEGYIRNDDAVYLNVPDDVDEGTYIASVTVKNAVAPAAGGGGTMAFTVIGAILVLCAVGLFVYHRKR